MNLKAAKLKAILEWWNCLLTKFSLQNILQLADAKLFVDVITVLFPEYFSNAMEMKSEECKVGASCSGELPVAIEIKTDTPIRLDDSNASKDEGDIKKDDVDVLMEVTGDRTKDLENKTENEVKSLEDTNSHLIYMRYKSLQLFIDEKYKIHSEDVVSYEACMQSNELELAKVAVLILTLVVKKCILQHDNDKLNTLTLIDLNTQEDIQECLSTLLQDSKITKKTLQRILTKNARYKTSPRKSPRTGIYVTPPHPTWHHSTQNQTPKNVFTSTPSAEEVFSDSPLKKFFDSPHIQNQLLVSKDKELLKTQKILYAEEIHAEDLQLELNNMKKKLEAKNKAYITLNNKNKSMRKENELLSSGKMELEKQIKVLQTDNEEIHKRLDSANKFIEDLEKDIKVTRDTHEAEINTLENRIKMFDEQQKTNTSLVHQVENLALQLKQKDLEYSELMEELENTRKDFKQEQESHACTKSLLDEKMTKAEAASISLLSPACGESLGGLIEEENKRLQKVVEFQQSKILEAYCFIEKFMKDRGESPETIDNVQMQLNGAFRNPNESYLSIISVPDIGLLSEKEKNNILLKLEYAELKHVKSPSTFNSCEGNSSLKMKLRNAAPRRQTRQSKVSESTEEIPVISSSKIGSIWNRCNSLNSNFSIPSSSNSDTSVFKADILRKLGFNEDEFPAKVEDGKQIIVSLKEYFSTKGSNGHGNSYKEWERVLKCDKDILMFLYYCKESILKYFSSDSNDYVMSQRALCICKSVSETMENLKTENGELKAKEGSWISQIEENNALLQEKIALIERKDEMIQGKDNLIGQKDAFAEKLKTQLQLSNQENKKVLKEKQNLQQKYNDSFKTVVELKVQLKAKTSELNELKKTNANLLCDKNMADQCYKKKASQFREKVNSFELKKREFQAVLDKEKKFHGGITSELLEARYKVNNLKGQRQYLQKCMKNLTGKYDEMKETNQKLSNSNKDLESEVSRLNTCVMDLKERIEELSKELSAKIQNNVNINLKLNELSAFTSKPEDNYPGISHDSQNQAQEDRANESCVSNGIFNRSLHSSLMLPSEDEAGYMSHSSLEEIQKPQLPSCTVQRVLELRRRNTLCKPHLQSAYPVEMQSISPFNASFVKSVEDSKRRRKEEERKARQQESCAPSADTNSHVLKKRKLVEDEAGPSGIDQAGPSHIGETLPCEKAKTPSSSFAKLLAFRRSHHRHPDLNIKP